MGLFSRKKETPLWLDETRAFCRQNGISISAWGPHALVVEAKTPERATEIATQLANFGFKPVHDEDDAYAGLLTLSHPE